MNREKENSNEGGRLSKISGKGKTNSLGIFSMLVFSLLFITDMNWFVNTTIVFLFIYFSILTTTFTHTHDPHEPRH